MDDDTGAGIGRTERRKARTRAALIEAAQRFIAEGRTNVPVLEITQAADLGTGSFYNHFSSKEELFEEAVEDALERHGAFLDALTSAIEDPAAVFAMSFRLTGRLHRRSPQLSRVLLNRSAEVLRSGTGLGPRVRRDIDAARDAGRFTYDDLEVVMLLVAGSSLSLAQRVLDDPDVDDAALTDALTVKLLRVLGLTERQASRIVAQPLPEGWPTSTGEPAA